MTRSELADLDEVVGRMTPGPWVSFPKPKYNEWHVALPCSDSSMKVALCPDGIPGENSEEKRGNAEGIAALRNSYSLLRDHIKALESKVKELEAEK